MFLCNIILCLIRRGVWYCEHDDGHMWRGCRNHTLYIAGYDFCSSDISFSRLSFPFQPSPSFSHLLRSSHYFTLPFPFFCTMKFSFHTVCHLDMADELCIFLCLSTHLCLSLSLLLFPDLHLLTRFPSLLPPPSVSQRRSDKIRPLTLLFVFTLIPLTPSSVLFFPSAQPRSMQSGILWFFMWREWSSGWLGGRGERVIKALVRFKCVFIGACCGPRARRSVL